MNPVYITIGLLSVLIIVGLIANYAEKHKSDS